MKRVPLAVQVFAAVVLGGIIGIVSKTLGMDLKVLGDAFIKLIEMTIVPLVFPIIVLGIAKTQSVRKLGRLAGKTLLYFEVVTTIIIIMSVALADITNIGHGVNLSDANMGKLSGIASGVSFKTFLLNIIPTNIFEALTQGEMLPIVFFAVFFGLALASVAERAKAVENMLEGLSHVMFKVIGYVVRFAPIGVFGFVAYDMAAYGWSSLKALAGLILVVYIGLLIILLIIFPIISRIFRIQYFALMREIWDLLVIAFFSRSSEAVFAPLMERLERYGAHNSVVSFVLPLGYSFNLDGGTLYMAPAILFLAHAYGVHLTITQQIEIVGLLLLLTKGFAAVPSGNMVALITAAKSIGLPLEGIALLMAVDFIVDMARTVTNVVGNSLASIVIAKSERMFDWRGAVTTSEQNVTG